MAALDRDPRDWRRSSLLNYGMDEDGELRQRGVHEREEAPITIAAVGDFLEIDLRRVFVWLKEGLKLAMALGLVCALLAASYGMFGTRRFAVTTEVLIEPTNIQVIDNDLYAQAVPQQGEGQALVISNRARLMTSGNVLARVVENLNLGEDPEFYDPAGPSLLPSFSGASSGPAPDPNLAALKALREKVSVNVDARSSIAELSVSAWTSDKAIALSEAIIDAFNAELAGTEAESARRAASSLDERLAVLKESALAAEEAVEDYKRTHGLTTGENGQLVSSQTLTETNTQTLAARTRVIEAQATYNSLLRATDGSAATIPGLSDSLRDLKLRAGALEQQLSAQRAIYGQRHPSIARLQSELDAARQQVKSELQRATNAAKAELDKANEALKELSASMAELRNSAFSDGQSQVDLRELQRDALAKTQIYESFLLRVRQVAERERITTDTVRVVSPPVPPNGRSWPPGSASLFVLGGFLGFVLGLGLAILRGIINDMRSPASPRQNR